MTDNMFDDAMGEQEDEHDANEGSSEFDVAAFVESLDEGTKEQTIGFGVTSEMKTFYEQLQKAEDVDIDLGEQFRSYLAKQARRHEDVAEKAQRINAIENE